MAGQGPGRFQTEPLLAPVAGDPAGMIGENVGGGSRASVLVARYRSGPSFVVA